MIARRAPPASLVWSRPADAPLGAVCWCLVEDFTPTFIRAVGPSLLSWDVLSGFGFKMSAEASLPLHLFGRVWEGSVVTPMNGQ